MLPISPPNESHMRKIRVLDPILAAGLPTIHLAVELNSDVHDGPSLGTAVAMARIMGLKAVNLRTESPEGKNIKTGFHRQVFGTTPEEQMLAENNLIRYYQEFRKRGLHVALMESSAIDHWNAIAGLVERFGRLAIAGEVNLTPGLTHREAMTSGQADPGMLRNIERGWFGPDRARLYRILKNAGQIGTFYEIICVDNPKRILFYDVAKELTDSHKDRFLGAYTDSVIGMEAIAHERATSYHTNYPE